MIPPRIFIFLSLSLCFSQIKVVSADVVFEALKQQILGRQMGWLAGVPRSTNFKNLDRQELIHILSENYDVHVQGDNATLFDRPFLTYLVMYFAYIQPARVDGPVYLQPNNEVGPKLVRRVNDQESGTITLSLSKNAGQKIANRQIDQLIYKTNPLPTGDVILNVEYNNSLFEQLTQELATDSGLDQIFLRDYGIHFGLSINHPDHKDEGHFSFEEKLMLLRNLQDLPQALFRSGVVRLRTIARMRSGFIFHSPGKVIPDAARYIPSSETIELTDAIYGNFTRGEGSFLHEVGHAIWFGLPLKVQMAWEDLGWEFNPQLHQQVPKLKSGFISEYSKTSVEEDFAEHFSAYVDNSALLASKSPQKRDWLHQTIFPDVEYFLDAAKNLRIFIPSPNQDLRPPVLTLPVETAVKVTSRVVNSEIIELTADIFGLFDDGSGINDIQLELLAARDENSTVTLDSNKYFVVFPKFELVDPTEGHYRSKCQYSRDYFYSDRPTEFFEFLALDRSQNQAFFNVKLIPPLNIPGTFVPNQRTPRGDVYGFMSGEAFKNVEIKISQTKDGGSVATVRLPMKLDSDLRDISFVMEHVVSSYEFSPIAGQYSIPRALWRVAADSAHIEADILLPSHFITNQMLRLPAIDLSYSETSNHIEEKLSYSAPNDLENLEVQVPVVQGLADPTPPEIDANHIEIKIAPSDSTLQRNNLGGDQDIRVKVPLRGIDKGRGEVLVEIRTPSGKTLYGREYASSTGEAWVPVALPARPEEGEYTVVKAEAWEHYGNRFVPEGTTVPWSEWGQHTSENLAARGIRTKIHIHIPKPELEKNLITLPSGRK